MRAASAAAILFLSACASDRLALAPPPGVDFSGRWQLNVAESDDPQHLVQAANGPSTADPSDGSTGGSSGRRGRGGAGGGGGGGRGGAGPGGSGAPVGFVPAMPPMGALGEGLGWPGKALEIKQVGGVVAFTSDGRNRVCQPADGEKRPHHSKGPPGRDDDRLADRPADRPAGRDAPPPICGWSDKTLILQGGDPDDERPPYEEHYGLSDDGQRLVEVVSFHGGRSNGFTMSRVWDRVVQGCYYADDPWRCGKQPNDQ